MNERWMPIEGYEGIYEISDLGRVRSLWGRAPRRWMKRPILSEPRILKSYVHCTNKYCYVALHKDNQQKGFRIHGLVLKTFVGPCPTGSQGSHLDGDRTNNRLDNLMWESPKNNNARKNFHGTANEGERHSMAKLNNDAVLKIRELAASGMPRSQLAHSYGVTITMIAFIVRRKNWTHI